MRVTPTCWFHPNQLEQTGEERGPVFQRRGTAEQWIKEGKNAAEWTKLSCRTLKDNQKRFELFALAYNLANLLHRLERAVPWLE